MPTKPTPVERPEGATYRLNRNAAAAVQQVETILLAQGLPSYMNVVRAAARCAMVLDGRDKRTKPASAAAVVAKVLEPLRPVDSPSSAARWEV